MVESYGNYKVSGPWVKVVLSQILIPEVKSKHPGSRICAPEPLCFFSCALDETSHNHKRCLKQWHWLLHLSCWQWGPDAWTVRRALLAVSLNASCLSAAEEPDSSLVIHTWREILKCAISHVEITGKWLISCHFFINAERKWEEITDFISTDLRADSTNTLSAFKWIQATNNSLKFTFSQRTKIPWGRDM